MLGSHELRRKSCRPRSPSQGANDLEPFFGGALPVVPDLEELDHEEPAPVRE